jgi:hypothetical protein
LQTYADALAQRRAANVLIDSGAFTDYMVGRKAMAQGTDYSPITLAEYADWLSPRASHLWGYIALDVIRNPVETRRRLEAMVARGLRPMPVVVVGSDIGEARDLVQLNRHICIAGAVDGSEHYIHQRLWRVWEATQGQAMPHALGYFGFPAVFGLPVHSYDASTFIYGDSFGSVIMADARTSQLRKSTAAKVVGGKAERAVYDWLRACGVTEKMLRDRSEWQRARGVSCNLAYVSALVAHHRSSLQGRRMFAVIATVHQFLHLLAAVVATKGVPGARTCDIARIRTVWAELLAAHKADVVASAQRCAELLHEHTSSAGYPVPTTFDGAEWSAAERPV